MPEGNVLRPELLDFLWGESGFAMGGEDGGGMSKLEALRGSG
jgi:demethoxyubiquinone hydroxylase (CLK1/Coq7/Cat5 family)